MKRLFTFILCLAFVGLVLLTDYDVPGTAQRCSFFLLGAAIALLIHWEIA